MYKKSQAALEFLTTYGWAFLVILIMIGAVAYFGIFDPSKFLPSICNFGLELQCLDHQISATANTFKIRLKNNVGDVIDVSSMTLESESVTTNTIVTITANSNEVSTIKIYVDNILQNTCLSSTICSFGSTYSSGSHSYYTTATDAAGNLGTSATTNFQVG